MTPSEAATLLTIAAAFDNRKPDADSAQAWALALSGLRVEDCRTAIVQHYQQTSEWLMPADVIRRVRKIRADRLDAYGPISPPPGMDPDDTDAYRKWLGAARTDIADGNPPTIDAAAALTPREMPDLSGLMPKLEGEPA